MPANSVQRQFGADRFGDSQLGANHFGATKIYDNATVPEYNDIRNLEVYIDIKVLVNYLILVSMSEKLQAPVLFSKTWWNYLDWELTVINLTQFV